MLLISSTDKERNAKEYTTSQLEGELYQQHDFVIEMWCVNSSFILNDINLVYQKILSTTNINSNPRCVVCSPHETSPKKKPRHLSNLCNTMNTDCIPYSRNSYLPILHSCLTNPNSTVKVETATPTHSPPSSTIKLTTVSGLLFLWHDWERLTVWLLGRFWQSPCNFHK